VATLAGCLVPFLHAPPAAAIGDGSPDIGYGTGGAAVPGDAYFGFPSDIAVQSDGKAIVGVGNGDISVARLTLRGDLDPTFGLGGVGRINVGVGDGPIALAVLPDDRIAVVAYVDETTFAVARFSPSGAPDTTFSGDGLIVSHLGSLAEQNRVFDIAVESTGRTTIVGNIGAATVFVARYLADGSPDTQFDGDGVAMFTPSAFTPTAAAVRVQPDGKVVVGGSAQAPLMSGSTSDFFLVRFLETGSPDASFDFDGVVTAAAPPQADDFLRSIALQPDGKIVAVGWYMVSPPMGGPPTSDFEVMRFLGNGGLDLAFADQGQLVTSLGGRSQANDVVLQSDGKIIVAGSRQFGMVDEVVATIRLMPDGSFDGTWGVGGKATFDGARGARAIALQPDGKLLGVGIVGTTFNYLSVVRLENSAPTYLTIDARRLRDTRFGTTPAAGAITRIETGAPVGTAAVLVNLTAVGSSSPGYITADRCSVLIAGAQSRSNVNFVRDQATANLAVVPTDGDGAFCVYNNEPADLIVDLQGTYSASGLRFTPLAPSRKLDTRGGAKPAAGAILRVDTGAPGANAALVNLTSTGATTFGYLTAGRCSELTAGPQSRSNANYTVGRDVANLAVVALDPDGSFCIYSDQSVHVLVDLQGTSGPSGAGTKVYTPTRVFDTRFGERPATGAITRVSTGSSGATAALVNLTMTNAVTAGYITADRCSAMTPGPQQKSSGNFVAGQDVANAAVIPLDPDGAFCIYNEHPLHLVVDVQGLIS
jgi:uncharacterized delta-60 repeat protein